MKYESTKGIVNGTRIVKRKWKQNYFIPNFVEVWF